MSRLAFQIFLDLNGNLLFLIQFVSHNSVAVYYICRKPSRLP